MRTVVRHVKSSLGIKGHVDGLVELARDREREPPPDVVPWKPQRFLPFSVAGVNGQVNRQELDGHILTLCLLRWALLAAGTNSITFQTLPPWQMEKCSHCVNRHFQSKADFPV